MAECSGEETADENIPGPLGVKIDDRLESLDVTLAVPGIRKPGPFGIGKNTSVDIKLKEQSLRILLEIKKKPKPEKCLYVVHQLPNKVDPMTFAYKFKSNAIIITLTKQTPASWQNVIDTYGLDVSET